MAKPKNCMFQYTVTTTGFFNDYKKVEDTDLITRDEANALWHKYKPDFIRQLEAEYSNPEMGIWIDCKDNTDYHTTVAHLDSDTKWDGRYFYKEIRQNVDEPPK